MKIINTVVAATVAFQATHVPVSSAIKLQSLFSFKENNYYKTSSSNKFVQTTTSSEGHKSPNDKEPSGSFLPPTDAHIAQGGRGAGKGKGGGTTKHGDNDNKKCCMCTCYDTNDYRGKSRSYEGDYDSIDGEDYCLCNCSCGSKVTMPIIPTVPPPSPPPVEPSQSPVAPVPMPPPTVNPTDSPMESPMATPSVAPTVNPTEAPMSSPAEPPADLPTEPPAVTPTASPTFKPTNAPTAKPTSSPTMSPTVAPFCEIPPLIVPNPFDDVENVADCGTNLRGTTITADNTFIQLVNDITCIPGSDSTFLTIVGDNNTVDCGGFSVIPPEGTRINGFAFEGSNNVLQNCPDISGFEENVIWVEPGSSLYVFNVTVTGSSIGLRINGAETYVDGSNFSENIRGVSAFGDNDPFKVIIINSSITQNTGSGADFQGNGDACLADNDMSENNVNIGIRQNGNDTPNVTLANNNACNSTVNIDIADNTAPGTTTLIDTTCSFVNELSNGSGDDLNATVYGCDSCPMASPVPTASPTLVPTASPTVSPTSSPTVLPTATSPTSSPMMPPPTQSPTSGPTNSQTVSPTAGPTTTPIPVCEFPPLLVPDPFEDIIIITECNVTADNEGQAIEANNTLIQIGNDIMCTFNSEDVEFFLQITGDNNTVDCGGNSVVNSGTFEDAFLFVGNNNVIQNCPISGFTNNAVEVSGIIVVGSLYVFNIHATGNRQGLRAFLSDIFVDGSNLSGNEDGFSALGANVFQQFPVKAVIVNSNITDNRDGTAGVEIASFVEACLEGNNISGNFVNIFIGGGGKVGVPNVTLAGNNACNSTSNVDIRDPTVPGTTIITDTTCTFVSEDTLGNMALNATEYGCEPCPP